jgi:DNA modification methylase
VPPAVLDKLHEAGRIHWPAKVGGMPMLKRYLDEQPGVSQQDVWTDIPPMHNLLAERSGYPTPRPLALLERIIAASSNPGDLVLDPFCGCGTAVVTAEKLGRSWIGIDVASLAIGVIEKRFDEMFEEIAFQVKGVPSSHEDAVDLAGRDPFQIQMWAASRIEALP